MRERLQFTASIWLFHHPVPIGRKIWPTLSCHWQRLSIAPTMHRKDNQLFTLCCALLLNTVHPHLYHYVRTIMAEIFSNPGHLSNKMHNFSQEIVTITNVLVYTCSLYVVNVVLDQHNKSEEKSQQNTPKTSLNLHHVGFFILFAVNSRMMFFTKKVLSVKEIFS